MTGATSTIFQYILKQDFNDFSCYLSQENGKHEINNCMNCTNFYAIRPNFRPLPLGTALYCAIYDSSDLTSTRVVNVINVYDLYESSFNGLYFICWASETPHTIPLYIFTNESGKCWLTFSKEKKEKTQMYGLIESNISPVYVINPREFSDPDSVRFTCVNNACLPYVGNLGKSVFNPNKINPQPLEKCMVGCGLLKKPLSLTQQLTQKNEQTTDVKDNGSDKRDDTKMWVMYCTLAVFIIGVVILIYFV